jgi:hypothetical protein
MPSKINRLFVAGVLPLVTVACGAQGASSTAEVELDRPESVAMADPPPGYQFDTLAQLAATARFIVRGEVLSAERGDDVHGDVPRSTLSYREVTVRVIEQYDGPTLPNEIIIDQDGYDSDGDPYELATEPWLFPGDEAVYFLIPSSHDDTHFDSLWGGELHLQDDGTVRVFTAMDNPALRGIADRPWPEVEQILRDAIAKARTEGIRPVRPAS